MLSRMMTRKEQWVLLAFAGALVLGAATMHFYRSQGLPQPPQPPAQRAVPVIVAPAPPAPPPPEAPEVEPEPPQAASPAPAPDPPAEEHFDVVVGVVGEVAEPGVYTLDADARVKDLLAAAGGAGKLADLSDINLAARLIDGSTLTVPGRREISASGKALRVDGRSRLWQFNPPQYTISGWQAAQAQAAAAPAAQAAPPQAADAPPGASNEPIDLNSASSDQLQTLPGIGPKLAEQIIQYRQANRFSSVDDLAGVSGIGEKKLEAVRPFVTVR